MAEREHPQAFDVNTVTYRFLGEWYTRRFTDLRKEVKFCEMLRGANVEYVIS